MSFQETAQKIAGAVGTWAPGIASILALTGVGAPEAAAVAALGSLAKAYGLPNTASPDDTLTALTQAQSTDPDFKLKVIQAEHDFTTKQADQRIKELELRLKDTDSARNMATEQTKVTGKRDINLYVLAWVIIGGFLGTIITIIVMSVVFPNVNLSTNGMLNLLVGSLGTDAGMVVGYFFGTSSESQAKTDLLAQAEPIKRQ